MGLFDRFRAKTAASPRHMLVDEIEQALRALGWVHGEVGLPLQVSTAFGAGEMPFERWLAQVYLPRLHEVRRDGRWPTSSHVAVAAWRNLDGLPEAEPLLRLLARLDDDINKGAR